MVYMLTSTTSPSSLVPESVPPWKEPCCSCPLPSLWCALLGKYGGRIYEQTRLRKADSSRKKLTTMEGHTVRAKQGYVLATASPITSSIVDSALHVLALHAKQHVRRR